MIYKKYLGNLKIKFFTKIALVIIISLTLTNMLTLSLSSLIIEQTFIDLFTLSNDKILDQIATNFDTFDMKTLSVMNAYRQSRELKHYFVNKDMSKKELFKVLYKIRTYLESAEASTYFPTFDIVTLGKNGKTFVSAGEELMMSGEELKKHPITQQSLENPKRLIYTYNDSGLTTRTKENKSIIATMQLRDTYISQPYATVYITIDEKKFSEIYSTFASDKNRIMILDKQGIIVSSNMKTLVGQKNEELLKESNELIEAQKNHKIYKNKHLIIVKYLPSYQMYLINEVNINTILQDFIHIKPQILNICLVVILFSVGIVFLITRRITRPLTHLVKQMKNTKDGDFCKVDDIKGSYEVQEIQMVYNDMIDEIDEYIKTIVKEQKQRRQAELETLQMQINPHFLYNTLATIKYLSWQQNVEGVVTTINALINLLQNTLHSLSETISIKSEIENLKNYVTINHVRYGEAIQVQYEIEEECLVAQIPGLTLQPFIENAFFHGYQEKKEGTIRVFVTRNKSKLLCEVLDDGDGIPRDKQTQLLNKKLHKEHFSSIGINNVNERIKLIYGEAYGVEINSEEKVGTVVKIVIPFIE